MFGRNHKNYFSKNFAFPRKKIMSDMVTSRFEMKKPEAVSEKKSPEKCRICKWLLSFLFLILRFLKDFFRNYARKKKIAVFTLTAFLIIAGFWLFLEMFSRLTLKITPHQEFFKAETVLKGKKDGFFDFPVETISFKITEKDFRPIIGEKEIKTKARGRIVIYNAFSSEDQLLVRRTRFETPDGKIYRISEQIIVPGAEIKDGKIAPSSVEAEIFADQPGEEYNIGLTDFIIPGFKGTARYSKFYARSKTPLEGGFSGTARVVSDKDAEEAKTLLKSKLAEEIIREYKKQIPENFILFEGAYETSYEEALFTPLIGEIGENLTTALTANFKGILIKNEYFSKALVKAYLGADFIEKAAAADIDQVNKKIISQDFEKGEIILEINNVRLIWHFNESELKNNLMAGNKSFNEIFGAYDEIERAELVFWPSWWRRVPNNAERINIEKVLKIVNSGIDSS